MAEEGEEVGFGSVDPGDAGFGAPEAVDEEVEYGFGDPYVGTAPGDILPPLPVRLDGLALYGDEGGDVVTIRVAMPDQGPFKVRLLLMPGETPYPLDTDGCHAEYNHGSGTNCYAPPVLDRLAFVLPSLPQGEFSISVTRPGGEEVLRTDTLLRIIPRGRAWPIEYATRNAWASLWKTGPRRAEDEAWPEDDPLPYAPLRAMLRMISRSENDVSGRPSTRLRDDFVYGYNVHMLVESVLDWRPDGGVFWMESIRWRYEAAALDFYGDQVIRLLNVTPVDPPPDIGLRVPAKTPIVLATDSIKSRWLFTEPKFVETSVYTPPENPDPEVDL